ncbi:alpha/beta-hydrolase [Byssothecium circinans]|uniref:Alpha/beta-hydrolase n=1 Tax=Byssothecium circinans TaxID=147558 RepID=A0A6A5UIP7_9PLEO|nr:alpha/beta-hydrolase [Byssothecium circinans]
MSDITSFDPTIPQDEVDRLFRKLSDTRLPKMPIVPDAGDDYGPSLERIYKLYNYCLDDFKWSESQRVIAAWQHFPTEIEIEGLKVHFIHERIVMKLLLSPSDTHHLSFDLVTPSLPGFRWSQGPPQTWTLQDTARTYHLRRPHEATRMHFLRRLSRGLRPLAATHRHHDARGEKYQELTDANLGTATLEKELLDDVCTTLCLYFLTPPSVYTEFYAWEEYFIRVPSGLTTFPHDAFPVPKAGVESTATDLGFFRGEIEDWRGHFACMECPEDMVRDLREFLGVYYSG